MQRKAARFIKNCRSREQGTVTKLLADLKWDTLQVRREKARLLMFYKATHGQVDIPLPDTLIPLSVRNTRQYHPKKFYAMVSNTKSYKGTFLPSTVAMWNSLPPSVLDKPNIPQSIDKLQTIFIRPSSLDHSYQVSFVFLYEFRLICKFNFALHFFSLPLLLKSFIALAPMYPRYGYRLCGLWK